MKYIFVLIFLPMSCFVFSQNPNDCTEAILVCGSLTLGLEPDGVGFDEFSLTENERPSCYSFNSNTIWFQFHFQTDGVFAFTLIPYNGTDDYDFAVYGPNVTCANLGSPIRCSSTNPRSAGVSADTGLNTTESDTYEGPGANGNGFLKAIDVNAGDRYFVLVDRPQGFDGFDIDYTGSSILPSQPNANYENTVTLCESDDIIDGITSFNFDTLTPLILANQNASVTYYNDLNDASIGTNPLPSIFTNTNNSHTIYYRIENAICFSINNFEINVESPNTITIEVDDFNTTRGNSATVFVTGNGDYEYAVDQQSIFTENNILENLTPGSHIAYVRSKNNCGIVSEPFFVLDCPRVITPNNDGFNDKWYIIGIESYPSSIIQIFNRYGKLLKELDSQGGGWDGTFNGIEMPSDDYWFTVTLNDDRQYISHFTLKR